MSAKIGLASVLRRQGDTAAARRLLEDVLNTGGADSAAEESGLSLAAKVNFANVVAQEGDIERAESL